jgi:hypothetical protein
MLIHMKRSIAFAIVLGAGACLYAQEFRATLSGRITDPQDAFIAGVNCG